MSLKEFMVSPWRLSIKEITNLSFPLLAIDEMDASKVTLNKSDSIENQWQLKKEAKECAGCNKTFGITDKKVIATMIDNMFSITAEIATKCFAMSAQNTNYF